jgi:hypothetical protein
MWRMCSEAGAVYMNVFEWARELDCPWDEGMTWHA